MAGGKQLISLLVGVVILLAACQAQSDTTRFAATPTPFIAPAPDATATATDPAPTATTEPTATATTVPPTVTPAPDVPLSETGPWLLYEETTVSVVPTDPAFRHEMWLSNIDGSAFTYLDQIPPRNSGVEYIAYWGPVQGRFAAGIAILPDESNPMHTLHEHRLYVWELPQQRLIAKMALLSDSARAQGAGESVLHAIRQRAFSPDARWLAFAAAIDDGTSDLYLLDVTTGEIDKAAEGTHDLEVAHWSPDGRWLLYYNTEEIYIEGSYPDEVWVYDTLNGTNRYLYSPTSLMEDVLGWLDADTAITVSAHFEGNPHSPRRVNMATGEVVLLDEGSFGSAEFDPSRGVLLVNRTPVYGYRDDTPTDVFEAVDARTLEVTTFVIPESKGRLAWVDAFQLFMTEADDQRILFDATGKVEMTLPPGDLYPSPRLSPDGQSVAAHFDSGWDIYAPDGTLRADLNAETWVEWLPDGRLLVIDYEKTSVTTYSPANNWQPEPVMLPAQRTTSLTLLLP